MTTKDKFSTFTSIKTGKLNSNAAVIDGVYPFFTCSQETYKTNTYSFDGEYVLLGGNNAAGIYPLKYYYGKFDAYQRTYAIQSTDTQKLKTKYLYYALIPELENLKSISTGATTKFLTITILNNIKINIPEGNVQDKIASVLYAYDKLIENNNKRIKILEEMAQTLYNEWFVNFRFPGHEKVKMVDSELGKIPDGWTIKKMEDLVVRFTAGKKYDNKTVKLTGKVPVLDQGQTGIIGFHDEEPGFIASWDNPVIVFANHTCYQKIVSYPFSAIQNVIPFKPINETMNIVWLHYSSKDLIKLNDYKGHWPEYMSRRLVIPGNLDITGTFGTILIPMLKEIELFEKRNTNLSKTRDLLVPKLISGELDVSEIDI